MHSSSVSSSFRSRGGGGAAAVSLGAPSSSVAGFDADESADAVTTPRGGAEAGTRPPVRLPTLTNGAAVPGVESDGGEDGGLRAERRSKVSKLLFLGGLGGGGSSKKIHVERSGLGVEDDESVWKTESPESSTAIRQRSSYVVTPQNGVVQQWDAVMVILLLFTSSVTPYEVSFLATRLDALFFINRLVDMCFLCDMVLQFNLAYVDSKTNILVEYRPAIAANYFKSWFVVDVISIIPVDVISISMDNSGGVNKLRILRIVRLMRLMKLLRIMRATRIFTRLESNLNVNYALFALSKFVVMALMLCHWMACSFQILADLQGAFTWSDAYSELHPSAERGAFDQYITCFYWAMTTMSTIGYGDVVPQTTIERLVMCLFQLMGASLFAYVVGAVCGIISGMGEKTQAFYETMDELNRFMEEHNMPLSLRAELRSYIRYKRTQTTMDTYQNLLGLLTPRLRSEVAFVTFSGVVRKLRCFQKAPVAFMERVCVTLRQNTYTPREIIMAEGDACSCFHILSRGVASSPGRVYARGCAMYFERALLRPEVRGVYEHTFTTLTFCETFSCPRSSLLELLQRFPETARAVRRSVLRATFREHVHAYSAATVLLEVSQARKALGAGESAKNLKHRCLTGTDLRLVSHFLKKLELLHHEDPVEQMVLASRVRRVQKAVRRFLRARRERAERLLVEQEATRSQPLVDARKRLALRRAEAKAALEAAAAVAPENATHAHVAKCVAAEAELTRAQLALQHTETLLALSSQRLEQQEVVSEILGSRADSYSGAGAVAKDLQTPSKRNLFSK
mmetsp:Transcript_15603/g.51245  ORF Transcript_15603/g.51245 Transcript_15603/m.51245 type:complete len:797 (-) Transcript_15603:107-2497(-)